jgi:hypothetical protein
MPEPEELRRVKKKIRMMTYLASMAPGEEAKGPSLMVRLRHADRSCTRRARGSDCTHI